MSGCASVGEKRRNFKDAGRVCPIDYRLTPELFSADPRIACETLYVAGGLYGNPFAVRALDERISRESGEVRAVLNGDIHWFDRRAENFAEMEDLIGSHIALVGNVEAELRRETDVGVGCGCSYPDCTSDADVSRSNRIHSLLSRTMRQHPDLRELLQGRPAALTVSVAGMKVGITHGDEKLIGGWDCSRESLQDPIRQDELSHWMHDNDIEVLATTHTCAAAAMVLRNGVVINNGAAGMPNFSGQHFSLATRIAKEPSDDALFRTCWGDLVVEAVPLRYDHDAYLAWFDDLWRPTSPAAISYRKRIVDGPEDYIEDALLGGFEVCEPYRREAAHPRIKATEDELGLELARLMYFEDMVDDAAHLRTIETPLTLQANITKRCNLACSHCHAGAGPQRTEEMDRACMEAILCAMESRGMQTLDITGGAPEMNPHFGWFIGEAAARISHIMVRSNLVILREPGYGHLLDRYAELGVEVVASLPNLNAPQSERQRGRRTFDGTLAVLEALNRKGYGKGTGLVLDLVFNPQWPILPPKQEELEAVYRRRLEEDFGIVFDNLFAVANNPIGRYGAHLLATDQLGGYMETLMDAFNPDACEALMCRHQISVGYDGRIYDCDFNQVLGLAQEIDDRPATIFDYAADPAMALEREVIFRNHCYACAAGFGSSCGGTLVQEI